MFAYTPSNTPAFSVDPALSSGITAPHTVAPAASASSAMTGAQALSIFGAVAGVLGGINTAYGAYASARSTKSALKYQAAISALNAEQAEKTAQSVLHAGEQAQSQVALRAGKVKASQKVSQAARGVQIGVGNAAEEIATTDLMKEADMLTINANATRQAWAARMQATNYSNESLMQNTSAESISPGSAAFSSLLTSAAAVSPQWYRRKV